MASIDLNNLFSVNGLVAVITGGGTGIGLVIAKALASNGAAKVYIVGRRKDRLEAAAADHPNIIPLVGDVTSKDSLQSLADTVQKETGYINLLIANSGISGPHQMFGKSIESLKDLKDFAWNIPMEDFTETYHVNCTGVFYTVLAFLELLDAGNKKGNVEGGVRSQVIATASIGAFNRKPIAGFAYASSKAGVVHLMKQCSTFCAPWGVRFNVLAPGLFYSEMTQGFSPKDPHVEGSMPKEVLPAERYGTPEEMGGTVLWMASKAGGYCNGNVVVIDGGRLSMLPATY